MIFIIVLAVLGAAALGLGLITLPILLSGAGPLSALVRPDLVVVFARARRGPPGPALVATKRYVFVVQPAELSAHPGLLAWLGAPMPGPTPSSPADVFETSCRTRLSDPRTTVAEIEHAFATGLAPDAVLELASLPSHRVETKRGARGFHFARADGRAQVVNISSQADALALQRFLAPGW